MFKQCVCFNQCPSNFHSKGQTALFSFASLCHFNNAKQMQTWLNLQVSSDSQFFCTLWLQISVS